MRRPWHVLLLFVSLSLTSDVLAQHRFRRIGRPGHRVQHVAQPRPAGVAASGLEDGARRPGGDYRHVRMSTAAECRALCMKEARCKAFTFEHRRLLFRRFGKGGTCWLKASTPPLEINSCCVSGLKPPRPKLNLVVRTLADALKVAALSAAALDDVPSEALARALFIFEVERPGDAEAFRKKLAGRMTERDGAWVSTLGEISQQASHFRKVFLLPCDGSEVRLGAGWPPTYSCPGKAPLGGEPTPVVTLPSAPLPLGSLPAEPTRDDEALTKDPALAARRTATIAARDRRHLPRENLSVLPTRFWAHGKPYTSHRQVAQAIYGARAGDSHPVFCAPRAKCKQCKKVGDDMVDDYSDSDVECSANWLDTLGGSQPWDAEGKPNPAIQRSALPPYACFGAPHLTASHMVVPPGGSAGSSGFLCRRRIFRVLATRAATSQADVNRDIATLCAEMRKQVWEEKYSNINALYLRWCQSAQGPKDKSRCKALEATGLAREGGAASPPAMLLSREELLYFYGHRELYCRADRPGLTHFLFNERWADTFTCGVPRGIMESGPFEEGVQTCAIAPYTGENLRLELSAARKDCSCPGGGTYNGTGCQLFTIPPGMRAKISGQRVEYSAPPILRFRVRALATCPKGRRASVCVLEAHDLGLTKPAPLFLDNGTVYAQAVCKETAAREAELHRTRLHCWKFSRPACEELASESAGQKSFLPKANVFDAYDALRELRRTHHKDALSLFDLKDAEKLEEWRTQLAFADSMKDNGVFGVKKFCRFVGNPRQIRCGYDKETMARWYELRQNEEPIGCESGVCARGAFKRGYYCAIMRHARFFEGEPFWMCGIDVGPEGEKLLGDSRAICLGGTKVQDFQSARGESGSLQCYARRFRWGESQQSALVLLGLDWARMVANGTGRARKKYSREEYRPWLAGYAQGVARAEAAFLSLAKAGKELAADARGTVEQNRAEINSLLGDERNLRRDLDAMRRPLAALHYNCRVKKIWPVSLQRGLRAQVCPVYERAQREVRQKEGEIARVGRRIDDARRRLHAAERAHARGKVDASMGPRLFREAKTVFEQAKGSAVSTLVGQMVGDSLALSDWARRTGHTLSHRTSMRRALMESNIPLVQEFRALSLRPAPWLTYLPMGQDCRRVGNDPCWNRTTTDAPRNQAKSNALTALLDEVRKGERSPSDRWFQEFLKEATEGDVLRVRPEELAIALRITALSYALDLAREELFAKARDYASAVLKAAASSKRYSRPEVHEMARLAFVPFSHKGNLFCVNASALGAQSTDDFVCASSPLLVAGLLDLERVKRQQRGGLAGTDAVADAIRQRVKFPWCYGATRGWQVFGPNGTLGLSKKEWSSPYAMELPPKVVYQPDWLIRRRAPSAALALKALREDPFVNTSYVEWVNHVIKSAPPALRKFAMDFAINAVFERPLSRTNWLRCGGFQFSDEPWELADPAPTRPDIVAGQYDVAPLPGAVGQSANEQTAHLAPTGNPRADRETARIMRRIGGLMSSLVRLVLPQFNDVLDRVKDLGNIGKSFIDPFLRQFVEIAKGRWEDAARSIETARQEADKVVREASERAEQATRAASALADQLQQARDLVERELEALEKAALDHAKAAPGPAKERASERKNAAEGRVEAARRKAKEVKSALDKATQQEKDLTRKAKQAAESADAALRKRAGEERAKLSTIAGTENILAEVLNQITNVVSARAMATVEPHARRLLNLGLRFVRGVLDPIAQSVISALAGIPFVGAGLAALGQVAYSLAMNALEDAAVDLLKKAVEGLLAKGVRAVVGPLFSHVKSWIQEAASAACKNTKEAKLGNLGDLCAPVIRFAALSPRDQWIERAVACRPPAIIDERAKHEAVSARMRILRTASHMRREIAGLARDLADHYFARAGLSYDAWMAAVGTGNVTRLAAARIGARLSTLERRLRGRLTRK